MVVTEGRLELAFQLFQAKGQFSALAIVFRRKSADLIEELIAARQFQLAPLHIDKIARDS